MAKFCLVVNSTAKPGRADEYSEWGRTQHLPDILRIPGVVAVKRYKVMVASPEEQARFKTIIELDCDDARDVMLEIGRRNGTPDMPRSDSYEPASVSITTLELESECRTIT